MDSDMVKIMLVEDDKSLREIYGARLLAEGYDIVSAGDGEEALAIAIKEKPQLIISDVMMPKISGFDMLDILHSNAETKNTKVIMMTALSSEDQRRRGEELGADRYLVKSQVGIEDVVRVVHEVLEDSEDSASEEEQASDEDETSQASQEASTQDQEESPQDNSETEAQLQQPSSTQPETEDNSNTQSSEPTSNEDEQTETSPPSSNEEEENQTPTPAEATPPETTSDSSDIPGTASGRNNTIQPINDPSKNNIDINQLLAKEAQKEGQPAESSGPATTEQERQAIEQQIGQFEQLNPDVDNSGDKGQSESSQDQNENSPSGDSSQPPKPPVAL